MDLEAQLEYILAKVGSSGFTQYGRGVVLLTILSATEAAQPEYIPADDLVDDELEEARVLTASYNPGTEAVLVFRDGGPDRRVLLTKIVSVQPRH
jgi:hypothetical protein